MSEDVYFELHSVGGVQTPEGQARLGRVIDAFPEFAPEKMGPRDPPRTPVTSVEAQLRAWAEERIRPGDYFNQFMVRRRPVRAWGLLWITGDIWGYPPIAPHKLEFGVAEEWFAPPQQLARLDRYAAFFAEAADAFRAFWGGAGLTSLRRQANELPSRHPQEVAPALGGAWHLLEHALPDIYWLNYFGPSYVARWGDARLAGVGVRRVRTEGGGILVWATTTPFAYDASVRLRTDYAWKGPFFEALGRDAIAHEAWRDPGRGVAVPTFEEHRRVADASSDAPPRDTRGSDT